ncbi:MAG: DUF4160 domain-containing protein [Chloroflexota bacterium]|nr:DUF4160 domain-containing protein [Chloroflexota bacterium]
MPTILRMGPYRLFFYSSDGDEPIHIHVEREDMLAKFWLEPVRLQESGGFNRSEIVKIQRIVFEHRNTLIEAWNEYFSN